ncbi:MAG: hypothetical protein ACI92E_000291 [Oceanicoccus sp.]|jgi:hypothetical protein
MSRLFFRPYSFFAVFLVCSLTSACSANLPTPAWIDVKSVGVLCRVSAADNSEISSLEDQACQYATMRLQQSLGESYVVDRITPPDARILEASRVTLVFDARLEWHSDIFQGYTMTLSSSRYRHNPGSPARPLFFESPSVVLLPQSEREKIDNKTLLAKLKPALELHLRRLMQ